MSMAAPSRVSTPNTTRSSGMNSRVTAVTSTPAPEMISPRRSGRCPSGRQKPDRNIMSQQAWYSIMLTRSSPRSSSSRA